MMVHQSAIQPVNCLKPFKGSLMSLGLPQLCQVPMSRALVNCGSAADCKYADPGAQDGLSFLRIFGRCTCCTRCTILHHGDIFMATMECQGTAIMTSLRSRATVRSVLSHQFLQAMPHDSCNMRNMRFNLACSASCYWELARACILAPEKSMGTCFVQSPSRTTGLPHQYSCVRLMQSSHVPVAGRLQTDSCTLLVSIGIWKSMKEFPKPKSSLLMNTL